MDIKILRYFFLFFLVTSFWGADALAQTGTIRGFVYDKETGEPIIFTNVVLEGNPIGASTDVNGYFSISGIKPGQYTVMVTTINYDTIRESVTLKNKQIIDRKFFLKKKAIQFDVFNVSAEKIEAQTEVRMSVQKITPREIEKLPSVGGEADLAQYLQVLPGVVFTGDQGGQLYIRGGSPVQNKVLLDGMVIYNPFHSIGLFSVFDTDIMRNADIYTGGFGAQYGGRISSVMDITTRDGNKNRLSGKVSSSTFGVKGLLEGPISRPKTEGGGSSSFILSAKHAILEQTSEVLYEYANEDGLPFNYTDLYGKISLNGANGSKLNLFGFSFNDQVDYQQVSDLSWNNVGAGTNFILVPRGSPILVQGNLSFSNYEIELEEGTRPPRRSSINGFNFGLDFTYFVRENEINYGVEVLGFSTDFEFFNQLGRSIQQEENTTELAGYLSYKMNYGKLVLEPSMRGHFYASLNELSLEPRLGAKYNVTDNVRIKVAGGFYSQNLISANSDRDVVNLFYGFLSGPDDLPEEFVEEDGTVSEVDSRLQKAQHAIVGVEVDVTSKINVNVEGYLKRFTQLTNVNRDKIFNDDADNFNRPERLRKDFIVETGDAMGVDFVVKYKHKGFDFWAVYSLGVVDRWDGLTEYKPIFDRRHNVNLLGTYTFGADNLWDVSVRWNFGSGLPFTQTQGFYEDFNFQSGGINTDYTTENGDLGIQFAELNGGRLPVYHRMDITVKRTFILGQNTKLEANVGVTNAYDRTNIFFFDRVSFERVDQLPILPNAGVSFSF